MQKPYCIFLDRIDSFQAVYINNYFSTIDRTTALILILSFHAILFSKRNDEGNPYSRLPGVLKESITPSWETRQRVGLSYGAGLRSKGLSRVD